MITHALSDQTCRLLAVLLIAVCGAAELHHNVVAEAAAPASRGPSSATDTCPEARPRVAQLIPDLDSAQKPSHRAYAVAFIDKPGTREQTAAQRYAALAGSATLLGRPDTAAWAALKAADLEWTPFYVGNAGVALVNISRPDDASPLLDCAFAASPHSTAFLEARAILASRRQDPVAVALIGQAVSLKPTDFNLLYSAGVIAHGAGQVALATAYLRRAEALRPDDRTVQDALAVVDPVGSSKPRQDVDELTRLRDDLFSFMDELVVRGERDAVYRNELDNLRGPDKIELAYPSLKSVFDRDKADIRAREKDMRDYPGPGGRPHSTTWNGLVHHIVSTYFDALGEYFDVVNRPDVEILLAASMRMSARSLMQEFASTRDYGFGPGSYFGRQAEFDFRKAMDNLDQESPAYCAQAVALWTAYQRDVVAKMNTAIANYPRVAAQYATGWLVFVDRARDFAYRGIGMLRPVPPAVDRATSGAGGPTAIAASIERAFAVSVGGDVGLLAFLLDHIRDFWVVDGAAWRRQSLEGDYPWGGAGGRNRCGEPELPPMDAVEALAALVAAFREASEFKTEFEPSCELEIGSVTVTFTPNGPEGVSLSHGNDPVDWEVGAEDGRTGVSVSTSVDDSLGPVTVELEASVWAEAGGGEPTDYGVQLNGKAGLGVKKKGLGSVSCYLLNVEGRISVRTLSQALLPR